MKIVNFSHPLTAEQLEQLENQFALAVTPDEVIMVATQLDTEQPFVPQVVKLLEATGIPSDEWQRDCPLVVVPSLGVIAALLVAEIEGRAGHLPPILRLKPRPNSLIPRFDVAEIINLHARRDTARTER